MGTVYDSGKEYLSDFSLSSPTNYRKPLPPSSLETLSSKSTKPSSSSFLEEERPLECSTASSLPSNTSSGCVSKEPSSMEEETPRIHATGSVIVNSLSS